MMQSLGIRNFRLSIAWPRIFPQGRGEPNPEGLAFYSGLIDALLAAGIEPHVTLYHWDLPQALMVRTRPACPEPWWREHRQPALNPHGADTASLP